MSFFDSKHVAANQEYRTARCKNARDNERVNGRLAGIERRAQCMKCEPTCQAHGNRSDYGLEHKPKKIPVQSNQIILQPQGDQQDESNQVERRTASYG